MSHPFLWTRLGARLELMRTNPGLHHWIFLPGGPGLGSESLFPLIDILTLPGNMWRVDLPGDGSNTTGNNAASFRYWSEALVEAVEALSNVVLVAHSRGGMFALATPELEKKLKGLVLMTTAPDMGWQKDLESIIPNYPLPEADIADENYRKNPSNALLRECVLTAAPRMFFTDEGLKKGLEFLSHLPYNHTVFQWAEEHFDPVYQSKWIPEIPTLILSGEKDIAIPIRHFQDKPAYHRKNILMREIPGAGHFPWIENPHAVMRAFQEFSEKLQIRV